MKIRHWLNKCRQSDEEKDQIKAVFDEDIVATSCPVVTHLTSQDTTAENVSLERIPSDLDIIGAALFDVVRKEVPALNNSNVRTVP